MGVDAGGTIDGLDELLERINGAAQTIAVKGALLVQQLGMARTHVLTGTLRRSWHVEPGEGGGGVYSAKVGPTTVYARRQELGFTGPDSLGRIFTHDPGWPYVRPAREAAQAPMVQLATRTLRAAIGA